FRDCSRGNVTVHHLATEPTSNFHADPVHLRQTVRNFSRQPEIGDRWNSRELKNECPKDDSVSIRQTRHPAGKISLLIWIFLIPKINFIPEITDPTIMHSGQERGTNFMTLIEAYALLPGVTVAMNPGHDRAICAELSSFGLIKGVTSRAVDHFGVVWTVLKRRVLGVGVTSSMPERKMEAFWPRTAVRRTRHHFLQ
ncbi:hypothetical protein BaRGS_00025865, partial [Batillaria attramentaria]